MLPDPDRRTTLRPDAPLDLARTLGALRRGHGDPSLRYAADGIWKASRTPAGPATLHLRQRADGAVEVAAWGVGAEWAVAHAPDLVGLRDDRAGWAPDHPLLRELDRRFRGLRVPRSRLVLESLVPGILEQKVTGDEARRSWRHLLKRYGEPAPGAGGAHGLRLMPEATVLARLPSWDWHRLNVEWKRAGTVRGAALVAGRLEECAALPLPEARTRLRALPGVGEWTVAEVAARALGDADAVSVGDYHLPSRVGWALTGRRTDDAGMLKLLEPFRPHRGRAVRLIEMSGLGPPRRGPRMTPGDIRAR